MAAASKIEWTNKTWNPTVGCSIVSPGCHNCYAMRMATRLVAMGRPEYAGVAKDGRWTGTVRLVEARLTEPMRWRKPAMVFVDSMSDLCHEDVPDEFIDKVFAVMALCPQHTFQVLTKRAERMAAYFQNIVDGCWRATRRAAVAYAQKQFNQHAAVGAGDILWPLPNVWLGVSCEDQKRADERIPHLLRTPAAVRFISAEPLLGAIEFGYVPTQRTTENLYHGFVHPLRGWYSDREQGSGTGASGPKLDWVIVGGESGPGARPCDVAWLRSIRDQCAASEVACFVKQLGSRPVDSVRGRIQPPAEWKLRDPKGGDPAEWPEDLRVRQYPQPEGVVCTE